MVYRCVSSSNQSFGHHLTCVPLTIHTYRMSRWWRFWQGGALIRSPEREKCGNISRPWRDLRLLGLAVIERALLFYSYCYDSSTTILCYYSCCCYYCYYYCYCILLVLYSSTTKYVVLLLWYHNAWCKTWLTPLRAHAIAFSRWNPETAFVTGAIFASNGSTVIATGNTSFVENYSSHYGGE